MAVAGESIKAMLESVRAEKKQLEDRLETLEERENTLQAWFAEEQPRQAELPGGNGSAVGGTPLSAFLRSVLADGKPRTTQELATLTAARGGLIKENSAPGRVVHFAMIGLLQHELVRRTNDGERWVKK